MEITATKLEKLVPGGIVRGVLPEQAVSVVSVNWFGSEALELTYKTQEGKVGNRLLYRDDEASLELVSGQGLPWGFNADGELFRLVSEAMRIRLAYLFDPVLAVHTSLVEPLPHQITAVYDAMLPRQPLRFLLADDPGAGKTIMAGLLIKELIARGDLKRCLIVCPGSLAEQWQDELYRRFHLPFEILTNDKLEASRTGNWFLEHDLVIARLDKLARDENLQEKLKIGDARWDLVVCDEAHKMSATVFGGETKYTKRYRLGELLSNITRHFLLMSATPHNGKEMDFQLFMALLDADRFEGRFREGTHTSGVSDMMRRMVKEDLYEFDGKPLFPERKAYTVSYRLTDAAAELYKEVTDYVREEFNRAEALEKDRHSGTVGFALTILQRRLASSPEAIYQSLRRRRERLESRLRELEVLHHGEMVASSRDFSPIGYDQEDLDDIDDGLESDWEKAEEEILDQATAARSIGEFRIEIARLKELEALAFTVKSRGDDAKWRELASLIHEIFSAGGYVDRVAERPPPSPYDEPMGQTTSASQKLVIFTEHRDTLNYLQSKIQTMLGSEEAVVLIHGSVRREDRLKAQEAFRHDPTVKVLLATDAAGEGINLQRAHLMVNYDLPWNPNRLEQRFGRIHRIGQKEVCHLWNLVADETREGDVYRRLLEKLNQASRTLKGKLFDVLGKLEFDGKPLRELLIEAIRFGHDPERKIYLETAVDTAFKLSELQKLFEDHALAHDVMDHSKLQMIREKMERAQARRLQPHYIKTFFQDAFKRLGGKMLEREPRRYEVRHVPSAIIERNKMIGNGDPVLTRYERIAFEKELLSVVDKPMAAFVCPGHPLLDAVLDLTLERHRNLLKSGAILVDERDHGTQPRLLFYLEHSIQDAIRTKADERRVISKRMLYVELSSDGTTKHLNYAPYLDYRALCEDEPTLEEILSCPECAWVDSGFEKAAQIHAVSQVVPEHLKEVKDARLPLIEKTRAAVRERLIKEIAHWDWRAEDLLAQEQAGKTNARLNSNEAKKRADLLRGRLDKRLEELEQEAQLAPLPPVVLGGVLVIPEGLLLQMTGRKVELVEIADRQARAARARAAVMATERSLGFEPVDRELDKLGYDIESRRPTGGLRFIEVKGRASGAKDITFTRNEILTALNKPENYIIAIVEFTSDTDHRVYYLRNFFSKEPEFEMTCTAFSFEELLRKAGPPS